MWMRLFTIRSKFLKPLRFGQQMRVVSNPGIAERADKVVRIIVDTYFLPNKTLPELRAMMESGALDFLRDFSEACHEELALLSSRAIQFEYRRA